MVFASIAYHNLALTLLMLFWAFVPVLFLLMEGDVVSIGTNKRVGKVKYASPFLDECFSSTSNLGFSKRLI